MYNTSSDYKAAIEEASNLQWGYSIKVNDTEIDSSTVDKLLQAYQQSCYYMNSLSVGNVVSQYINMTLRGASFSLTDSVIEPTFSLGEQSVPMGKFNVLAANLDNGNTIITAYDNVKKLDKAYSSVINYPATIAQVVSEIATLCGVTFDTTGITYPSITIHKAYTYEKCSQVMSEICKLMGCNLVADRTGTLVYKWFSPSGITYPIDNHWKQLLDESDYTLGRLSCTTSNGIITSGDDGSTMIFKSDYMTQEQLDSIKTVIAMTYRGADLEISGDVAIDPWDIITVTDSDNVSHAIPVMNNILVFDGAVKNTIKAFAKSETESEYGTDENGTKKITEIQKSIDGIRVNLQNNYSDNNQMQATIEATAEEIAAAVSTTAINDALSSNSVISQLSDQIVMLTDQNGHFAKINLSTGEIESNIIIDADNISLEGVTTVNGGFKFNLDGTFEAVKGTVGGFNISSAGITYLSDDGLNIVVLRPVQSTKSNGVLYVGTRESTSGTWKYPVRLNGDGSVALTDASISGSISVKDSFDIVTTGGQIGSGVNLLSSISFGVTKYTFPRYDGGSIGQAYLGKFNFTLPNSEYLYGFSFNHNLEVGKKLYVTEDSHFASRIYSSGNILTGGDVIIGLGCCVTSSDLYNLLADHNNGNITLNAKGGYVRIGHQNTNEVQISNGTNMLQYIANGTTGTSILCPTVTGKSYLGSNEKKFINGIFSGTVYLGVAAVITSDERKKDNIAPISVSTEFIMALSPREYTMKSGTSGRKHWGLIAQEVKEVFNEVGLKDASVYIEEPTVNKPREECTIDELELGLRYEELIAPMIATIQEQQKKIESLEARLEALEKMFSNPSQ